MKPTLVETALLPRGRKRPLMLAALSFVAIFLVGCFASRAEAQWPFGTDRQFQSVVAGQDGKPHCLAQQGRSVVLKPCNNVDLSQRWHVLGSSFATLVIRPQYPAGAFCSGALCGCLSPASNDSHMTLMEIRSCNTTWQHNWSYEPGGFGLIRLENSLTQHHPTPLVSGGKLASTTPVLVKTAPGGRLTYDLFWLYQSDFIP